MALLSNLQQNIHTSVSLWDDKKDTPGPENVGDADGKPKESKQGEKGKGGRNGGGHLRCPKCGSPCTHVETFVCKYDSF